MADRLVRPASVDTPGLSHRQNNDFFLKTSPVNSLLTAGSGHCPSKLHLGSPLIPASAAVPVHSAGKENWSGRGQPGGREDGVVHTSLSRGACPMPSQSCLQPSWNPHQLPHGWGHRGGPAVPSPSMEAPPHRSCSWSGSCGGESGRPGGL